MCGLVVWRGIYSTHYTLYTVRRTVYGVQCTVYGVQMYTVRYIIYMYSVESDSWPLVTVSIVIVIIIVFIGVVVGTSFLDIHIVLLYNISYIYHRK